MATEADAIYIAAIDFTVSWGFGEQQVSSLGSSRLQPTSRLYEPQFGQKQGKPVEQCEFKEGKFVIVLGKLDDQGILHTTRIDPRLPR